MYTFINSLPRLRDILYYKLVSVLDHAVLLVSRSVVVVVAGHFRLCALLDLVHTLGNPALPRYTSI